MGTAAPRLWSVTTGGERALEHRGVIVDSRQVDLRRTSFRVRFGFGVRFSESSPGSDNVGSEVWTLIERGRYTLSIWVTSQLCRPLITMVATLDRGTKKYKLLLLRWLMMDLQPYWLSCRFNGVTVDRIGVMRNPIVRIWYLNSSFMWKPEFSYCVQHFFIVLWINTLSDKIWLSSNVDINNRLMDKTW